jgi:hypothetical protein
MPVDDWTRVDSGTFHAFHTAWIAHLMGALNRGLLPPAYYALAEQLATRMQTDILTLCSPTPAREPDPSEGGVALAEVPPAVRLTFQPDPSRKPRRTARRGRHLVIRHNSGDRVVALIEIVSPANKDRRQNVRDFAEKVVRSLEAGIHVLVIDILPVGRHDPQGIHGAVWGYFDTGGYTPPPDGQLTLVSYRWDGWDPFAFVEPLAVGRTVPDMPLFLTPERYVSVPLESTYQVALGDMPPRHRAALEQGPPPGSEE